MDPKQWSWEGVPIDESLDNPERLLVGLFDYVAFILIGPGLLGFVLFKDVLLAKILAG